MFCGHHLQVLNNSIFEYKFSKWGSVGQGTTRWDCPAQLPLLSPSPGWVLSSLFPSPSEQGQLPLCFSSRVLCIDMGRVGLGFTDSGCFQWSIVTPPHRPQQAVCRHSPRWSRDSGETTVPWAAHRLWTGAAGMREGQRAGSASLTNPVTAPQSGHMGALQSVGQVHVPSVCVGSGPEVPLGILADYFWSWESIFPSLWEKQNKPKLLTWALVTRKAHLREFSLISIVQETVACVLLVNRSVSSVHFYPDVANSMNNTMSRKALNIKEKKELVKAVWFSWSNSL